MKRDGFRCRVEEHGVRCDARKTLTGHHIEALAELWERASSEADFIRLATDLSRVVTACQRHNNLLDVARRALGTPSGVYL